MNNTQRFCACGPIALLVLLLAPLPLYATDAKATGAGRTGLYELNIHPKFLNTKGAAAGADAVPRQRLFEFLLRGGQPYPTGPESAHLLGGIKSRAPRFTIKFDDWLDQVESAAKPLTLAFLERGIRVKPREARIAVLLPVVRNVETKLRLGSYSFFSASPERLMYVIYADRPCRIEGFEPPAPGSKGSLTFDVQIAQPGFSLILQSKYDAEGNELAIAAQPESDLDLITALSSE